MHRQRRTFVGRGSTNFSLDTPILYPIGPMSKLVVHRLDIIG